MKKPSVKMETVTENVSWLRCVDAFGWGWNTVLVKVPSGGVFLYSPSWFGPETFPLTEEFGIPRIALAPNHFHHLALKRYLRQYEGLDVVCSDTARPRLEKQGHTAVASLSQLAPLLPNGARVFCPDGTKTGETWVSIPTEKGNLLLVCDAVFNLRAPLSGWKGYALKALSVGPGVRVSRTFQFLAVSKPEAYLKSFEHILNEVKPSCVLPSHGEMLQGEQQIQMWRSQSLRRLS